MSEWIASELHCHTYHSDGSQTLLELARTAGSLGIQAVALTDHNTISGHAEIKEVFEETGVYVIRGLEHTTFYGHVLTLGNSEYMDWRGLGRHNLGSLIEKSHQLNYVVGAAHPFRLGTPICTGCHFDFEDGTKGLDYIEVWSGVFPTVLSYESAPAFNMWTALLNKGYRIAGTSGRDWHGGGAGSAPVCRTFLRLAEKPSIDSIDRLTVEAIKRGRISVSMAHCIVADKKTDTGGRHHVEVSLDSLGMDKYWAEYEPSGLRIIISSNLGELYRQDICSQDIINYAVRDGVSWLRAELHGRICGTDTMLGFANPVYF